MVRMPNAFPNSFKIDLCLYFIKILWYILVICKTSLVYYCCIYWHFKRRQNRNVTLSVMSLSAVIFVPFASIYLLFSRVLSVVFKEWHWRSYLVSKRSLVIISSNTSVFTTSSKFKVVNYIKLVVKMAFAKVLLVLLLGKR